MVGVDTSRARKNMGKNLGRDSEAKLNDNAEVTLWGSGTSMREFLFVDDMAEAVVYALENKLPEYLYNEVLGKTLRSKNWQKPFKK